MAVIDTIEGILSDSISFHYDIFTDVLYLRRLDELQTPEVGEEDEHGLVVLRAQDDARLIGLTIVSFWKRFGQGLPGQRRVEELAALIEHATSPWQQRLRAA